MRMHHSKLSVLVEVEVWLDQGFHVIDYWCVLPLYDENTLETEFT